MREHERQSLNARLVRYRSQPQSEDPYQLAEDLLAHGRYAEARSVARNALTDGGDEAVLLLLEGRAYLGEQDLVRAQGMLQRAVAQAPELQPGYRYLGAVLFQRGDHERAVKTLRRALTLAPDDAEAAELLADAERAVEAAQASAEARSLFPRRSSSRAPQVAASAPASARSAPAASSSASSVRSAPGAANGARGAADSGAAAAGARGGFGAAASSRGGEGVRLQSNTGPSAAARPGQPGAGARSVARSAEGGGRQSSAADGGSPAVLGRLETPSGRPLPKPYFAKPSDQTRQTRPRRRRDDEATAAGLSSDPAAESATRPVSGEPRWSPPEDSRPAASEARARGPLGGERPAAAARASEATAGAGAPAAARARPVPQPSAAHDVRAATPARAAANDAARPAEAAAEHHPWSRSEPATARLSGADAQALADSAEAAVAEAEAAAVVCGSDLHRPVDADETFALVQRLGLFEQPGDMPMAWAAPGDVEHSGQRLRNTLIAVWTLAVLLAVGGYFGFQAYVAKRHAEAARALEQAQQLALRGDHAAFAEAERSLRLARERHPSSPAVPREALLLQVARLVDDDERDVAALRNALTRAQKAELSGPEVELAQSLIALASDDAAGRDRALAALQKNPGSDARLGYLLGRVEQRAGRPEAAAHLSAAAQAAPKLVPAQLALAIAAYDAGDRAAAERTLRAAHAAVPEALRVQLVQLMASADDGEPRALTQALDGLSAGLKDAGNTDRALAALLRARIARRSGQPKSALPALTEANDAASTDARVLAWIAREALALGNLTLAQALASQALIAQPQDVATRRLLARILIDRHDGAHALLLLDKLATEDAEAQLLFGEAALAADDAAAEKRALQGLSERGRELGTRAAALRLRIEAKQSPGPGLLARARALVKSAPGDADALFALAETALAAHEPASAQRALKQLLLLAPEAADAHCLLGRALRNSGDANGAEASLRRALELSPGHVDALATLAALLLDEGKYADAEAAYRKLVLGAGSALAGRLGRVEALIGLAQLDAAQVQLDAIPEPQRGGSSYREVAAKLALARNEPGPALHQLRPLIDAQNADPQLLALYGDALALAQQSEAAANAFASALAADAGLPEALLGSAELQLVPSKLKQALALLERAEQSLRTRIRPPALRARRLLLQGRAYLVRNKRGDAESARAALSEAATLQDAPHEAFYFLGEALGGQSHAEAVTAYKRYLELEPRGRYRERARRAIGGAL